MNLLLQLRLLEFLGHVDDRLSRICQNSKELTDEKSLEYASDLERRERLASIIGDGIAEPKNLVSKNAKPWDSGALSLYREKYGQELSEVFMELSDQEWISLLRTCAEGPGAAFVLGSCYRQALYSLPHKLLQGALDEHR